MKYSYIYLLQRKKQSMFKIGKTTNIRERYKKLNGIYLFEPEESYLIKVPIAEESKIESVLHYVFDDFRISDLPSNDGYTEFFDTKCISEVLLFIETHMKNKIIKIIKNIQEIIQEERSTKKLKIKKQLKNKKLEWTFNDIKKNNSQSNNYFNYFLEFDFNTINIENFTYLYDLNENHIQFLLKFDRCSYNKMCGGNISDGLAGLLRKSFFFNIKDGGINIMNSTTCYNNKKIMTFSISLNSLRKTKQEVAYSKYLTFRFINIMKKHAKANNKNELRTLLQKYYVHNLHLKEYKNLIYDNNDCFVIEYQLKKHNKQTNINISNIFTIILHSEKVIIKFINKKQITFYHEDDYSNEIGDKNYIFSNIISKKNFHLFIHIAGVNNIKIFYSDGEEFISSQKAKMRDIFHFRV